MKVAIYSGEIPSSTFIERLIKGVASTDTSVYLFGSLKRKVSYPPNVYSKGFGGKGSQLWFYLKYSLLLLLFRSQEKARLDKLTGLETRPLRQRVKMGVRVYPVLWYKPDIFHIQWAKETASWLWVQEFGIKLMVSLRGAHINYSPIADPELAASYRQAFPRVDAFHAVSEAIKREAAQYGAEETKVRTIYSGLSLSKISFAPSLAFWKEEHQTLQLISVGRAHWKKGFHYALDTCKQLQKQGLDFHYTIIGGAGDEELLFKRANLELADRVELRGPVTFSEVEKLMRKADLLLLPSVEEGIANVVLEAMAMGTPVIATNCGGMNEIIRDGENGWIVPVRNPGVMAVKVQYVSQLPLQTIQEVAKLARQSVEEQHSEEQMIQQMVTLYQDIFQHDHKVQTERTDKALAGVSPG